MSNDKCKKGSCSLDPFTPIWEAAVKAEIKQAEELERLAIAERERKIQSQKDSEAAMLANKSGKSLEEELAERLASMPNNDERATAKRDRHP